MKKFGLFLLKNNIHIMTLIFLGFAVWAGCNWASINLIQKYVIGLYFLIVLHEYEEVGCGFIKLMGSAMNFKLDGLKPGMTHIAQMVYITLSYAPALLFPDQLWLSFALFILAIFEGFVHTMGIFLFQLRKPSPGWYTAVIMAAYAIWALVKFNATVDYPGIQWLWGVVWFVAIFALLEAWFQHIVGNKLTDLPKIMRPFLKQRFGKK